MYIQKNREGNMCFIFKEDEEHVCDLMLARAKLCGHGTFPKIYTKDCELYLEWHWYEADIAILCLDTIRAREDVEDHEKINDSIDRCIALILDWEQEAKDSLH